MWKYLNFFPLKIFTIIQALSGIYTLFRKALVPQNTHGARLVNDVNSKGLTINNNYSNLAFLQILCFLKRVSQFQYLS